MLRQVERQQNICRLDVTVDQAVRVGRVDRRRELDEDCRGAPRVQRAGAGERRGKVSSLHEAHRDEQDAVIFTGLVHRDHVDVLDRGSEARFALEPLAVHGIRGSLGCDQLDCNRAVQRKLGGAVDDSHPAAADRRLEPVAGDDVGRLELPRPIPAQDLIDDRRSARGEQRSQSPMLAPVRP